MVWRHLVLKGRRRTPVRGCARKSDHRNGAAYCRPPWVHKACRPRARPIGVEVPMVAERADADVRALGVEPRRMAGVLGGGP